MPVFTFHILEIFKVSDHVYNLGQAIGFVVDDWKGCDRPRGAQMPGNLWRLINPPGLMQVLADENA